jgi:hypothetical protein
LLKNAYEAVAGDGNTSVNLGAVGQQLQRLDPSFDSRAYGHKKLSDLLKSTGLFIIDGNNISLQKK